MIVLHNVMQMHIQSHFLTLTLSRDTNQESGNKKRYEVLHFTYVWHNYFCIRYYLRLKQRVIVLNYLPWKVAINSLQRITFTSTTLATLILLIKQVTFNKFLLLISKHFFFNRLFVDFFYFWGGIFNSSTWQKLPNCESVWSASDSTSLKVNKNFGNLCNYCTD